MEHTGLLFLFTCQATKSSNLSRSGVNVRAHILRKNYSRNFNSIRRAPESPPIGRFDIRGMFEMNCFLPYISISTWGTIKTNIYLSRFIQGLQNGE